MGMYDVVVLGAGPGGSAAARRCAMNGLKTLLIEKQTLPRDKVCTGMIMAVGSVWAERAFGAPVPESVLTIPHYDGVMVIVPGVGQREVKVDIPHGYRREMDQWMTDRAVSAGVEVWDGARVTSFDIQPEGSSLVVMRGGNEEPLRTRYLIGADGVNSPLRKALFPDLKVRLTQAIQEVHRGELALSKRHFNCFVWREISPVFWDASYKGNDEFVIEGGARVGDLQAGMRFFKDLLERDHGFQRDSKPEKVLACTEPILFGDLIGGRFRPAIGNALLVGDAAGLMTPITAEGIGNALKSGVFAADAIAESIARAQQAAPIYLDAIQTIIDQNREPYAMLKSAINEREGDQEVMLDRLAEYWKRSWVCA